MKCGNCKEDHATVQEVKNCYGSRTDVAPKNNVFAATAAQLKFIGILLKERDMTPLPEPPRMSKHEASEMITSLRKIRVEERSAPVDVENGEPEPLDRDVLFSDGEDFTIRQIRPKPQKPHRVWDGPPMSPDNPYSAFRTSPQAANWGIPAGHYAIESLTGNNDLDFYRIDRPEQGRWAGYTFVKMVIGGKPNMAVRGKQRLYDILLAIYKDPDGSAKKYGQEIGRCYRCNRHLTDETSRSLGIGPDCRSKDAA